MTYILVCVWVIAVHVCERERGRGGEEGMGREGGGRDKGERNGKWEGRVAICT